MIRKHVFALFFLSATLRVDAQELDIDHVWINVARDLDVRNLFEGRGFRMPGASDIASNDASTGFFIHSGQGTASTAVRFRNIYLEFIRVDDAELLRTVAPDHGYTLLNRPETSPFGIGLKLTSPDISALPFATSSHWAPWMRPLVSLATASRESEWLGDPAIFIIPDYMRWDLRVEANPGLLSEAEHALELGDVTRIRISGPHLPSGSAPVQYVERSDLIEFRLADDHLLELEFDDRADEIVDFRPTLPLVILH
jgi:hypothetical protein